MQYNVGSDKVWEAVVCDVNVLSWVVLLGVPFTLLTLELCRETYKQGHLSADTKDYISFQVFTAVRSKAAARWKKTGH